VQEHEKSVMGVNFDNVHTFIPASNEPGDCLQAFGGCCEGQIPRSLLQVFDSVERTCRLDCLQVFCYYLL